jgi:hypothetical protein
MEGLQPYRRLRSVFSGHQSSDDNKQCAYHCGSPRKNRAQTQSDPKYQKNQFFGHIIQSMHSKSREDKSRVLRSRLEEVSAFGNTQG